MVIIGKRTASAGNTASGIVYFDGGRWGPGWNDGMDPASLADAFRGTKTRFCVVSFTSDWLYPTRESKEIVQALNAVAFILDGMRQSELEAALEALEARLR